MSSPLLRKNNEKELNICSICHKSSRIYKRPTTEILPHAYTFTTFHFSYNKKSQSFSHFYSKRGPPRYRLHSSLSFKHCNPTGNLMKPFTVSPLYNSEKRKVFFRFMTYLLPFFSMKYEYVKSIRRAEDVKNNEFILIRKLTHRLIPHFSIFFLAVSFFTQSFFNLVLIFSLIGFRLSSRKHIRICPCPLSQRSLQLKSLCKYSR